MGLPQRSGVRQWLGGNELVAEESSFEAQEEIFFSAPVLEKQIWWAAGRGSFSVGLLYQTSGVVGAVSGPLQRYPKY